MEFAYTVPILAGGFTLFFAIRRTRSIMDIPLGHKRHRKWRILQRMMVFFLFGYGLMVAGILFGWTGFLLPLVSVVFLVGAMFVYAVVNNGFKDMDDLLRRELRAESRFEANMLDLLDELPQAMLLIEYKTGKVLYSNRVANAVFGYEDQTLVGLSLDKLINSELRDKMKEKAFRQSLLRQILREMPVLEGVRRDGSRVYGQCGFKRLKRSGEPSILAAFADTTRLKVAEEQARESAEIARRYNEELKRSNSELEQYAYIAAHDLQAPLRHIVGFTALLEQELSSQISDQAKDYMHEVISATKRMQSLIRGILNFGRVGKDQLKITRVNVAEVVTEIAQGMGSDNRALEVDCQSCPDVRADRQLLAQVFANLLDNAQKYCTEPQPRVEISGRLSGAGTHEVEIFVKDNGVGVSSEFSDRIFEMFQRLDNRFEGSGIGLAICKKIVELHGGKISVFATDRGSIFCVKLPAA